VNYPVLLFDLDQTLFDTDVNAQSALRKLDLPFDFAFDDAQIAYCHHLNWYMWGQFEKKTLSRTELINTRFSRFFEHFGITVDGVLCEQQFQQLFFAEHALMPHTQELLNQLQATHRLFVISNGSREKQLRQMADAHIDTYFEHLFLAEDLGVSKPDPQFFAAVEATLGTVKRDDMLVIGDSLTADILGAQQANLASVWYDPHHQAKSATIKPTYRITDLLQLSPILAD